MILFSCWEHWEMKNSFMSLREIGLPRGRRRPPRTQHTAKTSLKHAELLLLFQSLRVGFLGRGLDRLGLFCARARIEVTGLNVDERFFAQRAQKARSAGCSFCMYNAS